MFCLYFSLWLIFNGAVTPEICVIGLVVSLVVFAFTCRFMDYSLAAELMIYRCLFRGIRYLIILIIEIIKANFAVLHLILTEEEEIQPVLASFRTDLKTPTARAFLANAITLTPGTITVTLEGDEYMVHCLDESLAEGMDESIFEEQLTQFEALRPKQ